MAAARQSRARNQHYADSAARQSRVLAIAAWLAVLVCADFILLQVVTGAWTWQIVSLNVVAALIFAIVPWLHRFGDLVAPLTFLGAAYVTVFVSCWDVGTASGGQYFFLVGACLVLLVIGIEHTVLAAVLAAIGAGLVIAVEFAFPETPVCSRPGRSRCPSS